MSHEKSNVSQLNRYCLVCGKEFGPSLERHCTPDSLVAVKKEGVFKKKTTYFDLEGNQLDEAALSRIREREKAVKEKGISAANKPEGQDARSGLDGRLGALDALAQVVSNPIEQAKRLDPKEIPGCHEGTGSPRILCLLQQGEMPKNLPEWVGTVLKDKKQFPFQKDWKIYFQQLSTYPSQSSLGMYVGSHAQVFCEHHGLGTPQLDSICYAESMHTSDSKQTSTLLYSVRCVVRR